VTPERREITADDGLILAASDYGDKGALSVMLLHGGGQTRHSWHETALALASAGFRALAVDLRGHGESGWSDADHYDLTWFARDAAAVARTFERRPVLVGASMGGLSGILAHGEVAYPLLAALVLVDVAPRMEPLGVARVIAFMTANPDGFESLEQAADAVAQYLPHRPRPKNLAGLAKNLRRGNDGRYRWHWDPRWMTHDHKTTPQQFLSRMHAAAKKLDIPTLLIRGGMSDVLSESGAREFLEIVPHAEYVDVLDAAHMVATESNERFSAAILPFIRRLV
jgi:pimeloyl-ACP methyl ester carboxylesterase